MNTEHKDFLREFFKQWPGLYYFIMVVLGPVYFVNLSGKSFLGKYPREGKTINVGSGARVLKKGVVNIDIEKYEHVDVVAPATRIPFADGEVARAVYDNVLEHVALAEDAVSEASRVIAPGGYIYISTPFMYPFHSSPDDFMRWTLPGLRSLLSRNGFSVLEDGVRAGPFSVLILWKSYLIASLLCFGNRQAYTLIQNIVMILMFPIKILDAVFARLPYMEHLTSVFYIVGRRD